VHTQAQEVLVVADDTDVFVLLCHFVHYGKITGNVKMTSPVKDRTVININVTVEKHSSTMPNLLAAHGLTGCDTVAMCYGIGKTTALKVLQHGNYPLDTLGDLSRSFNEILEQATRFMLACYGQSSCKSMTDARYKVWAHKISQKLATAPKLENLPPTDEAFRQNVARAHLQVAHWRQATEQAPPSLDPCEHGWAKDPGSASLVPITVPDGTLLAPEEILQLIRCSCDSSTPCKSRRCSCNAADIACTTFCACQGDSSCYNVKTMQFNEQIAEED
jgi:hypothetical protein